MTAYCKAIYTMVMTLNSDIRIRILLATSFPRSGQVTATF